MGEAGTWISGSPGPYFSLNPIFSIGLSETRASSSRSSWELTENKGETNDLISNQIEHCRTAEALHVLRRWRRQSGTLTLCLTHESHCRVRRRHTVENFVSRFSSYHGYGSGCDFFGAGRFGDRRLRSGSVRRERGLRHRSVESRCR